MTKKQQQSLSARIIILIIAKILVNAIGLITAPIFTRILSVSDYGSFAVYLSSCDMIAIIFGLQTYSTLNNALLDFKEEEYKRYCGNILLLSILCFAIGYIVCFTINNSFHILEDGMSKLVPLIFLNAFFAFTVNFYTKYLDVQKNAMANLFISVFLAVSTSVLSVILVVDTHFSDFVGRILGYIIPYGAVGSIVIFLFIAKIDIVRLKKHWKYCIGISIPLVFHALSAIVLAQGDRIVIVDILNEAEAGIYSFCYTVAMPISIIWSATNTAWGPEYYDYLKTDNIEKVRKISKKYLIFFSFLTGFLMLVSPEIVKILAIEEYYKGIYIIPVVIMGYYFNYLYSFPVNYEFYHKKTKYIAISTMLASIINIALNYLMIPVWGILGAGIATMISYIVLFVIHDIIARYVIRNYHFPISFYLYGIAIVIPFFACSYFLLEYIFLRWFIASLILIICGYDIIHKRKIHFSNYT